MSDKEKIQSIFNRFYNYDSETKKVQEEFLENKDFYSGLLENTLRAVCEIERQSGISLPEQYKEFLKAGIGNYIYNPDSIDEFRAYDARELYEFNHVGGKAGYSAIEELKDFLIVGQDEGECSYFFDVHNTLGRGTDTFWRVNRCDCEDFEIVGNTFIEFLEAVASRKAIDAATPFEKKEEPIPENAKDILIGKLSERMPADELHVTCDRIEIIKDYLSTIRQRNDARFFSSKYRNHHIASLIRLHDCMHDTFPHLTVFILLNLGDFSFSLPNLFFELLLGEQLEAFNVGKKAKKHLKDMFVFAYNSDSLFLNIDGSYFDYFFVDPTNRLGNGPDAIYMISEKSKTLEEACHVAKDIVDLFRLLAEGAELNTTPIGKEIISSTVQDNKNGIATVGDYKKELSRMIPEERLQKLDSDIKTIKNYVDEIRKKDVLLLSEEYWEESAESLNRMQRCMADSYPVEFVYVLLNLRYFAFMTGNVAIEALILESFEKFNIGKRAKKHLHDVLVFALNKGEAYESDWDFVFVDYKNILGNGSNAIYMIGFKSKKLEEACLVAKDIVDLFRLFAEGAELNTTPLGKEIISSTVQDDKNGIATVESYALKNEKDGNYVFNPGWKEIKPCTDDYVSFLEKKCNEVLGLDPKLSDDLTRLERYLEIMKKNRETFHTRDFSNDGSFAYINFCEERKPCKTAVCYLKGR